MHGPLACTTIGVPGEVLAFVLLALYLMTALFFSWGWVPELIVVAGTAIPWALSIGKLDFSWPPLELAAAIGIGSVLSLAIAERSARSVRAAFHDDERVRGSLTELRRSEERLRQLARRQTAIREEERKRLGLGLHDDVCQELVGIAILIESVRQHLEPDAAGRERLQRAIHYVGEVGDP